MKFEETFEMILHGHKVQTSRVPAKRWFSWYKSANYTQKFVVAEGPDGEKFQLKIQLVTIKKLRWVRDKEFWEEGFSSPEAFEEVWKKMYRRFEPELDVCVLHFQRL